MTGLWIKNVQVFTPEERLDGASVWISAGRIQWVGVKDLPTPPRGIEILDGEGLVLAPGYIDLQINGAFGLDFTLDPGSIWEVARQLPQYGVTSFLPTVVTSPLATIDKAVQALHNGAPPGFQGALPLGLHLEGPFLNPLRKGAHNPAYLRPPDPSLVEGWTQESGVRLVTLAPELPGASQVIQQLRAQGVVVSAGHSTATYEQALDAFKTGVTYGTHLFNAMSPLEHRHPNLPGALLNTPAVTIGLIVDGIHLHPAIVNLAWHSKGSRGITLVTDAMAALGMNPGTFVLGDYEVHVDSISARLADGTLAGSILQPDAALRNLMAFTGTSLSEALPAYTSTPARVIGVSDRGRIQPGAIADLLLLTPDAHIRKTIVQGEVLYNSKL